MDSQVISIAGAPVIPGQTSVMRRTALLINAADDADLAYTIRQCPALKGVSVDVSQVDEILRIEIAGEPVLVIRPYRA